MYACGLRGCCIKRVRENERKHKYILFDMTKKSNKRM